MPAGRPRQFDANVALDRALEVFWEKGYQGASLPELTEAMGINRPSLYAAFGNKESLFRKALERYAEGPAAYVEQSLNEPDCRQAIEGLFKGAIEVMTARGYPGGCLIVQGALACGEGAEPVRDALNAQRKKYQARVRQRLRKAKAEGDLPKSADPAELARYVTAVVQGMAVQAAGGATARELHGVARLALRAWPA